VSLARRAPNQKSIHCRDFNSFNDFATDNSERVWFASLAGTCTLEVAMIRLSMEGDDCAIVIMFKGRTYLAFDVEPFLRIPPDYSDWKTHNYKRLKRWPPLRTE
jgi:hypothetical protein